MQSKPQLFCFTYAGGTAAFFADIEKDLPEFELVKLEYSGHGERHKEKFYENFDELVDDMFHMLQKHNSGTDYALFGYSMGSIILVEVLKRILGAQMTMPSHIFLAAHEPHTKAELAGFTSEELDEWVKQRTIKFGAVPEILMNNRPFWRMYLPLFRADYSLIGMYHFEDLNLKTDIPATVFYSETDTPYTDMKTWKKYFIGDCDYHCYEGKHFFIQEHHRDMAAIIRKRLCGSIENDF